ncbi:MAG: IS21 family transposase [Sarcina sp.]|uniref:IS21 family transposase n=1 Tax=Clostridium chrysemydis TaxID=2665504 RepID=UPI003F345ED5
MITLNEKQKMILDYFINGLSQREIHRKTGIARETIRKYIKDYENKLKEINTELKEVEKIDLINEITEEPKYKSGPRLKTAVTDEVVDRLTQFLKENETKRLTGFSKQQMKKIDMCEALNKEGFNVSYSSIINAVNKIEKKKKEAFMRQEYVPGDVVEFDFGTVKLVTEDNLTREYQLAVFTSAYSNYRWARLFPKQNTACFLEAHALFFQHIRRVFRSVVYDNTRVAVAKFISKTEKEPTDALLKLSLYYKFNFRFCNAYSGNEKGHVERSVEIIRRKAFSKDLVFLDLAAANGHLNNILKEINSKVQVATSKSANELLDEERSNLLPDMPIYETARLQDVRVTKYSTVMIDSCFYSVPDSHVDKLVRCKIYTNKILIFYNEEKIAEHNKIVGFNKWKFDIQHYTYTLFRKPKALINSTAFKQMDKSLKEVYYAYFKGDEKEFIMLLDCVGKYGIEAVLNSINSLNETCPSGVSIDKIEFLCTRKDDEKVVYLSDFKDDITDKSLDMLKEFNDLLNN